MTKATLFDSFYASRHNETVNYVADCADRPVCPFLKLINEHIRETGGGVRSRKHVPFHLKKNCHKFHNDPITTGLTVLCSNRDFKKDQYHNMWCYNQVILSFLTFLKHLAPNKKKQTSLCSWNLNWVALKQCKQKEKSIPNDKNRTLTAILQSLKKNKQIKNNDKSILQKEDPYNRLRNCSKGKKKKKANKKHQMLNTEQPKQVSQWR